jgi:hypothetical protein
VSDDRHESAKPDDVIAVLRSPALPRELAGEAAAVASMADAQTVVTTASSGRRSRRGVTVVAVTIAGLGLGGLAAAGPGVFSPAADRAEVTIPAPGETETATTEPDPEPPATSVPPAESVSPTESVVQTESVSPTDGVGATELGDATDVTCADGNHGRTVSSVAAVHEGETEGQAEVEDLRLAARSECGKPQGAAAEPTAGDAVECVEGNHGETVSSVANATEPGERKGAIVSEAARSDCGRTGTDDDRAADADADDGDDDDGHAENRSADRGKSSETRKVSDTLRAAPGRADGTHRDHDAVPNNGDGNNKNNGNDND